MNTASNFTHSPRLQSRHSTTFSIIMINMPTQKQNIPLRHNSTNSRPFATPTGVVNLTVHPKKAILRKCLNSALSKVFLPAVLVDLLHGNKSVKLGRNNGHQQVRHRNRVTETLCQRHWNSRGILSHKIYNDNKADVQWAA